MTKKTTAATFVPSAYGEVLDYFRLLKPRVMSLVVFTGFVGIYLAPGTIHPFIAAIAVFCIALGSGAAGAINMWYEKDTDALMERTRYRPLPAGRMSPESAIEFAVIMAFASVFIMGVAVNPLSALLLLAAINFYVFIYTIWLKPRTPYNIVIGGAAGALPPVIGWAAVTGSISIESVVLFLLIFMWTPPHFWALSLYRCNDYAKAGIPMLPVTSGPAHTRLQILLYSLLLFPTALLPFIIGMAGGFYALGSAFLTLRLIHLAFRTYKTSSDAPARAMFGYSIVYLFALFVLLIIDHAIR